MQFSSYYFPFTLMTQGYEKTAIKLPIISTAMDNPTVIIGISVLPQCSRIFSNEVNSVQKVM